MLAPLVADEPHRGHDVEHRFPEHLRYALWFATGAELRIASLVLRPQTMHDECMAALAIALLRTTLPLRRGAIGGRPGKRKDVKVEA